MKRLKQWLAPLLRFLAPGHSTCGKCGVPWAFTKEHSTTYIECRPGHPGMGCFPLCEGCWMEMTPETRLPFYRALWLRWQADGSEKSDDDWRAIEAAVRAGR